MTVALPLCMALAACAPKPESAPVVAETEVPSPRILQFYASPGAVEAGESTTICYGVENTKTVSLTPNVERLNPSRNRCFSATPRETTTYTLKAEGDGGEATASLVVEVRPARATPAAESKSMIRLFAASTDEVQPGQSLTICYSVEDAHSVRIDPPVRTLDPTERKCFLLGIARTTTFTLTAEGEGGRRDQQQLTVKVQ